MADGIRARHRDRIKFRFLPNQRRRIGIESIRVENFFRSDQNGRGKSASQYSRGSVGISTAK